MHAPSNAIPLLLNCLSEFLLPEAYLTLSTYWGAIETVSKAESNPNEVINIEELREKLNNSIHDIRGIGNNFKAVFKDKK